MQTLLITVLSLISVANCSPTVLSSTMCCCTQPNPPTYMLNIYHIGGNFRGRNLREFWGFVAICRSFLPEILGCGVLSPLAWQKQAAKIFSAKIVFLTNFRYMVVKVGGSVEEVAELSLKYNTSTYSHLVTVSGKIIRDLFPPGNGLLFL